MCSIFIIGISSLSGFLDIFSIIRIHLWWWVWFWYIFFQRGMLIDDLSQQCLMRPVNIINIIENVGHMEWNPRKVSVEFCLTEIFVASKGNFLLFYWVAQSYCGSHSTHN